MPKKHDDQPVENDQVHVWGRDIEREDFIEGHYGDDRHEPTPEGGQAGIAQGNTAARARTKHASTIRAHDRGDRGGERRQD